MCICIYVYTHIYFISAYCGDSYIYRPKWTVEISVEPSECITKCMSQT